MSLVFYSNTNNNKDNNTQQKKSCRQQIEDSGNQDPENIDTISLKPEKRIEKKKNARCIWIHLDCLNSSKKSTKGTLKHKLITTKQAYKLTTRTTTTKAKQQITSSTNSGKAVGPLFRISIFAVFYKLDEKRNRI